MDYIRGQNSRMNPSAVGAASFREIAPLKLFSGIAFRFNRSGKKRDLAIVTHNSNLKKDPTMKAKKQAGTTPANPVDGLLTVVDDT
jgi:hypothetical protein